MKKILIIAAALAASVACTKTTVDLAKIPNQKIAFEVANYLPQTKAASTNETFPITGGTSLWDEYATGTPQFHAYAFFYPGDGDSPAGQTFMNNVIVKPFNGASIATASTNTTAWQAADGSTMVDYFWPKTGHVNFFSIASVKEATITDKVTVSEPRTIAVGTAASPVTIASDDNILLADACYNATGYGAGHNSKNNEDDNVYVEGEATYGVPTLFRHVLTKVKIQMQLKTEATTRVNTDYVVDILEAKISDGAGTPTSGIVNNGYLSLTNDGPGDVTNLITVDWETAYNVKWSEANEPSKEAVIELLYGENATPDAATIEEDLTLAHDATTSTQTFVLLNDRAFRPQHLTADPKFYLTYRIQAKHGSTVYSDEIIQIAPVALNPKTPNDANWRCNDYVTYTVYLDPVTTTVTFDPAVAAWNPVAATDIEL